MREVENVFEYVRREEKRLRSVGKRKREEKKIDTQLRLFVQFCPFVAW